MADISSVNTQLTSQSLYFASAQAAAQQMAQHETRKSEKSHKTSFSSAFKKAQETAQLVSEGLPAEIAGMSEAEAIVFLKDAVDMAGDELKEQQNLEAMEKYRKKVGQFMKYVVRNNFEFIKKKRYGRNRKGKPVDPYFQIQIIDKKLNQLASEMLIIHRKNLDILAKIEEINGLIVDLMAE